MFELNHKLSAINHNLQRGTEPPIEGYKQITPHLYIGAGC
jgi:hypothetical protein